MSKTIYEEVLDLRNRLSLDGDGTIYEEDYLLLDEVLDFIENVGGEDTDIETQMYDYNNTVDIYRELEAGAIIKKQEKLLVLYKEFFDKLNIQLRNTFDIDYIYPHEFIIGYDIKSEDKELVKLFKQIKELEDEIKKRISR